MHPIPPAPLPAAKHHVVTVHGERIPDEFAWLRERENSEVIAYLRAENSYTEAVMQETTVLQAELLEEMKSRTPETDCSAPVRHGPYAYYARTEQGKNYRIRCRGPRGFAPDPAAETVLLDGNLLAQGHEYFELGAFLPSPDHRLLAYSLDFDGDEKFELRVRDIDSGQDLSDTIENTYYDVEWSSCGGFLFYTTLDESMRPYRLWRHRLGNSSSDDTLVFQEDDQAFHIQIQKTRSERFLVLESASLTTTELRLLEATQPEGDFRILLPRKPMVEYSVEHQNGWLWVLVNDTGRNFRLVRMALQSDWTDSAGWEEIIANRDEVCLESIDAFSGHLVVSERDRGLPQLLVMATDRAELHRIPFPEAVYAVSVGANPEFHSETVRISYESPITPPAAIDYGMSTRDWTVVKQQTVAGFISDEYRVERLLVRAPDGVSVPLSVVYRKGLSRDGDAPALLYGYGAYGLTVEAGFSPERLSLLERGFVFAIAHVRGGGELGETWHDAGKMEFKPNSFLDFVACAERLVTEAYTSPRRLGILGRSAGGLLVAASMNLRPDLFASVVASVPFVDVLNTMLDASLPLTVGEYEEWGNPADPKFFRILRSYSPYENLRPAEYPQMLVTAGLHDPRVSYWEPAKLVARLRRLNTGEGLVLLKTELTAGHFGPSGRYDAWKETAFEYAFLLRTLVPGSVSTGDLSRLQGRSK